MNKVLIIDDDKELCAEKTAYRVFQNLDICG